MAWRRTVTAADALYFSNQGKTEVLLVLPMTASVETVSSWENIDIAGQYVARDKVSVYAYELQ